MNTEQLHLKDYYSSLLQEKKRIEKQLIERKLLPKPTNKIWLIAILIFSLNFTLSFVPPLKIQTKTIYEKPIEVKNHINFLNKIAYFESRGSYNPKPANPNYHGKYQIGAIALKDIGMQIKPELFIKNPLLQELAMNELLLANKKYLSNYIGLYQYKTIKNIFITESGILAAAHLGGSSNVKKFLDSNGKEDFKDGNGTPISKYLKELSDYKLMF
jgi:hypothetical protein